MNRLSQINESIQEFRYQARQFFIYLPNKLAAQGKRLIEFLEKKFENVKNPFLPMQNWIAEKGKVVETVFVKMSKKGSEIINRFIVKPYRAVRDVTAKVQEKIAEALQPPINWTKERAKKAINKVKEIVEPRIDKAREWSKNLMDSGEKIVQQASQAVQAAVVAVVAPAINLFAPIVAAKNNAERALGRGKGLGKKIVEKITKAKDFLNSGTQKFFQIIKKAGSLLKKVIRHSYEIAKKTPLKLWKFFLKALAFIAGVARRIAFVIHLAYTWTRVLFRYTAIELRKSLAS